jgi:acyl-CoA dehydrogenase
MPYRAPVSEFLFCLEHVVGFDRVTATERFAEATPDTVAAMLTEAGRICEEVLAPLNRAGDLHPARLENGIVRTSPGFGDGWRAVAEAGFVALAGGPGAWRPRHAHGGDQQRQRDDRGRLPALQLAPLMSQGQIEALDHHASDELKAIYLPKLISGEWNATMNLTEAQAGSDVGAIRSRAEPNGDGTYAVSGPEDLHLLG